MKNRSRGRSASACMLVVVAVVLTMASSAGAGVPQKQYACYGEGGGFISYLNIKSRTKYDYLGDNGRYEFKAGPKVLKFRKGPLRKWVGHLNEDGKGDPAIKLVTDQAGGQTVDCYS